MLVSGLPSTLHAQTFIGEEGYVEFVSSAPLLEFTGQSNHLTGLIDLEENMVDFYVDLNTIDTGIELRNRHMRDSYLKTEQFPFAEFTGSLATLYDFDKGGIQEVKTSGVFSIHGVEREMDIQGTIEETSEGIQLEANWVVHLEDHDIDRPKVVFYELANEQNVAISIHLLKQED
ncbi:MAG: YceI family protein [Cyclonatronaceae bacterium]